MCALGLELLSLSLSLRHAISLGVSCSKHLCSQLANKLWSILTLLDTILECMYAILAEAVFCQIHFTLVCTTELHTTLTGVPETFCCLIIGDCMPYSHKATQTHTQVISQQMMAHWSDVTAVAFLQAPLHTQQPHEACKH